MVRWFTFFLLVAGSLIPLRVRAQAPDLRSFLRDSLATFRPDAPGILRGVPLDSLLRRYARADPDRAAREASAVDPGILILPDSSVQAAIRLLTPDEAVDEAMIFPRQRRE